MLEGNMKRILILIIFPLILFGQIKPKGEIKPDPIKPPVEEIITDPIKPPSEEVQKAQLIIDHQDVTIDKIDYKDAKLVYEIEPIVLEKCDKAKLITEIDAIKENAEKMTVEYRDEKLGKMSQVFLGKMPAVMEIKGVELTPEEIKPITK
jgi:hypothetical protein